MRQFWTIASLTAAAALLTACGDDETTTTEGGSSGGSTSSTTAPTTSTTSTTGVTTSSTTDMTSGSTTDMMTTGLMCTPPEEDCGGMCINTDESIEHCGGCDMPCGTDEVCNMGVCECDVGLVACDGACIDPMTDGMFCGASMDCMGPNMGENCGPTGVCNMGACTETCDNCSFESGDFAGWTPVDLAMPFDPLRVEMAGMPGNFFPTTPTDGVWVLFNGFDGGGPGMILTGQDITISADLTTATLEFDYRAGWNISMFAMQDRTFSVNVEPAGGGAPLQTDLILTAMINTTTPDTGPLSGSVDLSNYIGQTVFINFVWDVPESFTGPGQFQLDNVRVTGT